MLCSALSRCVTVTVTVVFLVGVSKVIVAVNQLDAVDWAEQRYTDMCKRLELFFATLKCRDIHYVPTSGFLGLNLERRPTAEEAPKLTAW